MATASQGVSFQQVENRGRVSALTRRQFFLASLRGMRYL
jgi:hypothetical protein